MATNPCCDIHFTCVNCPIITGPDCVPPNNLLPGQLWYNPCTCTFYFDCPQLEDEANSCETLTPLNYKPGAGIAMSGDCENGHFISVRIEPNVGLGFTGEGELTIDCTRLIQHCQLWSRENLLFNTEDFALVCDVNGICTLRLNPETPNVRSRNAGQFASSGICIAIAPTAFVGPLPTGKYAIFQARDASFIAGNGTFTGLPVGSYLSETFTNNWSTSALLEIELIAQPNFFATNDLGGAEFDVSMAFIHSITETLAVSPPNFGAVNNPVLPNFGYTQLSSGTPSFNPVPGPSLTSGVYGAETTMCKFTKVLAPNESVTIYYQWWAILFDLYAAQVDGVYTIHGGMATASKMLRNVIPL